MVKTLNAMFYYILTILAYILVKVKKLPNLINPKEATILLLSVVVILFVEFSIWGN